MPSRTVTIGALATVVLATLNTRRSVLILQNSGVANAVRVNDEPPTIAGISLAPNLGSVTLRKSHGEQPDKAWSGYSVGGTTVQVMELFGDIAGSSNLPAVENPQDPQSSRGRDSPRVSKR